MCRIQEIRFNGWAIAATGWAIAHPVNMLAEALIVHENPTQTRANMVKQLGQMNEKGFIVNHHTKKE